MGREGQGEPVPLGHLEAELQAGQDWRTEFFQHAYEADVIVVGLIGERGREVKDFIDNILGEEGRRRSVVVAAPADTSPLMRLQGAFREGDDHRDHDDRHRIEVLGPALSRLAKLSTLRSAADDEALPPTISAIAGKLDVMVSMKGVIDIDRELERIESDIAKQQSELSRLESKLSNESFVARAPAAVVDKDLSLRRLKFSDAIREANDELVEDPLARADADFLILCEILAGLQADLIKAFGGIAE